MGRSPRFERVQDCPPIHLVASAFAQRDRPFLLDSAMTVGAMGRYSFAGCNPSAVFSTKGQALSLWTHDSTRRWCGDPLQALDDLLASRRFERADYPVPFTGGAVGFLSYDLGRSIEHVPTLTRDDLAVPDIWLGFYDEVVAHDGHAGETYIVVNRDRSGTASRQAIAEAGRSEPRLTSSAACTPVSNFSRDAYVTAIEEVKRSIAAGHAYQVNLSQRFEAPWAAPPWALYQRARDLNPAPMSAYLDCGSLAVVSASPERFLRGSGQTLETRPIKGTRPRGATPDVDRELGTELVASIKDRAEHIMIVDLERSDLGRVAEVGSVSVDEMMLLESFPSVHHLTSTIRAKLLPEATTGAILRATFPGGSITGAPKIKAMEIIEQLEPTRRGVYTGTVGYFSDSGDFDLNIAIRTIVVRKGRAYLQVGGGIVADSDPYAEYQETLDKGQALFEALTGDSIATQAKPALQS